MNFVNEPDALPIESEISRNPTGVESVSELQESIAADAFAVEKRMKDKQLGNADNPDRSRTSCACLPFCGRPGSDARPSTG